MSLPEPPALPDRYHLVADILARAESDPDRIALAILGPARAERWSYARLDRAVRGMGAGLLEAGLAPGDRLLLRLGNRPDFPVAFLGAIAAGIVPVPTSPALTGPEITRLAQAVAPAAVLAQDGIALPGLPGVPVLTDAAALAEATPLDPPQPGDPDALAYIVTTSGTSGAPRLVAHAHRAVFARRMMWTGWYGLGPRDRVLHAGAFNWTYTLGTGLLDPWAAGATALIPQEGTKPEMLPLLMKRHEATIFAAAPGVYRQILKRVERIDLPKLRHGLSAGEKLPDHLRTQWRTLTGTDIHEALGMSECSTFLSGCPDRPAPEGTTGWPQPGRRLAVLDAEGREVADDTPGTLAIHRSDPGLMLGYIEEGGLRLPLSGEWFLTGDEVLRRASDGAFTHLGRQDAMITAGGYRIAPAEIEAAFAGVEGLEDCAALSHEVAPGTFVVALAHVGVSDEARLAAHAESCLARYKIPRAFIRLPALPRGPNGKLDRRALARLAKENTA